MSDDSHTVDLSKPNAPPGGGGTEREPPELLFSLARFDFLLFRLDDRGSFDEVTLSVGAVSVKIGSEEEAFSAAVLAFKRGNPEPAVRPGKRGRGWERT